MVWSKMKKTKDGKKYSSRYYSLSLIFGILGLAFGVVGSIPFGIFGGILGCVLSVIGVVMGINCKKAGNNKGQNSLVCGLMGVIFSIIFIIGYSACIICVTQNNTNKNAVWSGCIGASCQTEQ